MADNLFDKLCPNDKLKCSGKMTAILGCICGQSWTDPQLRHLYVTSDGIVLGEQVGDCGANDWLGDVSDLTRNLKGVADYVGLTSDERIRLAALAGHAVTVYGTPIPWTEVLGL